MADSFAQFAAKLDRLNQHLSGSDLKAITNAVALDAKRDAEKALDKDLGSDRKFRNWRPKLGVGYTLHGDSQALIKPRPSGPWSVLDGGRKSNTRVPSRKRGNRVLRTPYGPRTYSKSKPLIIGSTRGKGTWRDAQRVMQRETASRIRTHLQAALRKVFTS